MHEYLKDFERLYSLTAVVGMFVPYWAISSSASLNTFKNNLLNYLHEINIAYRFKKSQI